MTKQLIAEGKTKIIWGSEDPDEVLIESKDDLTAGDGAKHDVIPGKGRISNITSCHVLSFLEEMVIPTHFIERVDEHTMRAQKLTMIRFECVARRIATGSYLQRNPDIAEGARFGTPVFELFFKPGFDSYSDPYVIVDVLGKQLALFDAHRPLKQGFLGFLPLDACGILFSTVQTCVETLVGLQNLIINSFLALETAWSAHNVALVDLKGECGFNGFDELLLGDVIDNDSWRLWEGGVKGGERSKQLYRDAQDSSQRTLNDLRLHYEWVMDRTGRFSL